MALAIPDRVRFLTSTVGTGSVSVGAAFAGYQTPATAGVADGSTIFYAIEDGTAWETGTGTYTAGTVSRDVVGWSSAAGAKLSLSGNASMFFSVTNAGFVALFASPFAIGGTAPAAGSFTTLAVSGNATAPTAGLNDNSTLIATTAYYTNQAAVGPPQMDGTAAVGVSTRFARGDHVHPTDTTRVDQAGFRNVLINGGMDIWQRGTSFTAVGYGADRWIYNFNGTGQAATLSRQAVTEAALLNAALTYWLNIAITTAATSQTFNQLIQKIENVRTYSGRAVTLSYWAKVASGTLSLGTLFAQNFGTGGSPSATVNTPGATATVTTTPTRFTTTVTLPAITGLTRGSNGDDSLQVAFNVPLNALANLSISGVQLEPGPVATAIERRPEAVEMYQCQRFYQVGNVFMSAYTNLATTGVGYYETLGTVMRAAPTVTFSNATYTLASGVSAGTVTTSGFAVLGNTTAGGQYKINATYTASAEL
jgi:hypothetical protein